MSARRPRPFAAALPPLAVLALGGCGSPPAPGDGPLPDWRGPPVHCEHQADGGLAVVLTAPTGGHTFTLRGVAVGGEGATITCDHAPPTADFVTQVITPHRVDVPAARLGGARVVWVRVATAGGEPRLAVVAARPGA